VADNQDYLQLLTKLDELTKYSHGRVPQPRSKKKASPVPCRPFRHLR
jgi:hypothetical protein